MKCELSFLLNELIDDPHRYDAFNKKLEFVSFTQSGIMDIGTLDLFCISLLTSCGHVYTLSPLLLQHMVLKEEHFSNILLLI